MFSLKPSKSLIAALLAALIFSVLWLHEHDARLRASLRLNETRQATAAEVSGLEVKERRDVLAANRENAQVVRQLESERDSLKVRSRNLAARLAAMQSGERATEEQIAALPLDRVTQQIAAWAGKSGVLDQPKAGNGKNGSGRLPAAGLKPRTSGAPVAALSLTDQGARKVAGALNQLESCEAESGIESRQFSTCSERARLDEATIRRQSDSIAKLNQALAAKGKILAAREQISKAELKAARGTLLVRVGRTLKHVAFGLAIGLVAGIALK